MIMSLLYVIKYTILLLRIFIGYLMINWNMNCIRIIHLSHMILILWYYISHIIRIVLLCDLKYKNHHLGSIHHCNLQENYNNMLRSHYHRTVSNNSSNIYINYFSKFYMSWIYTFHGYFILDTTFWCLD